MNGFSLHPRLAVDTLPVADLRLSAVRLMNDARFPWLILVPRKAGISEVIDLLPGEQAALWDEVAVMSRLMHGMFKPARVNIAALGNMVPQLHVHLVARFENDAAWPKPVWGVGEAVPYASPRAEEIIRQVNAQL
jgi:diadenosine tetraphosphate (Ap4A) HIT family hydrolase